MRCSRYILALGVIALMGSVTAVKAENSAKMKMQGKTDAECKMDAAKQNAECTAEQKKEQMQKIKQQQTQKAEEMKNEAGKGSEKGQAMREEHSKKWWKFWGDKSEE